MVIVTYCETWDETLGKSHGSCYKVLFSIQERLSSATEGRISLDSILAWGLVAGWLFLAVQGEECAITAQLAAPLSIWILNHYYLRHRRHSSFYPALAAASLLILFGVFEMEVVPFMEILPHENMLFLTLAIVTAWLAFCIRCGSSSATPAVDEQNSSYCKTCETLVSGRDHHSIWLGVCIGAKNRKSYLLMLVILLFACLYGVALTLTTICHPRMFFGRMLLPDSCPEVFLDVYLSICFVSAMFALEISGITLLSLFSQIYRMICHSVSPRHHL